MKTEVDTEGLICSKCNMPLEMGKVHITYLKSTFSVNLPVCPVCGEVYVSEALALGKMLEVEKTLEEK